MSKRKANKSREYVNSMLTYDVDTSTGVVARVKRDLGVGPMTMPTLRKTLEYKEIQPRAITERRINNYMKKHGVSRFKAREELKRQELLRKLRHESWRPHANR